MQGRAPGRAPPLQARPQLQHPTCSRIRACAKLLSAPPLDRPLPGPAPAPAGCAGPCPLTSPASRVVQRRQASARSAATAARCRSSRPNQAAWPRSDTCTGGSRQARAGGSTVSGALKQPAACTPVQAAVPMAAHKPRALTATPQRWLLPGRGGRAPTMVWSPGISVTSASVMVGVVRGWNPSGSNEGPSDPARRCRLLICCGRGAGGAGTEVEV